jgi:VanZ family protein
VRGSPGRRSRAAAWIPVGLWILVIFGLSSIPDLGPPQVGLPLLDKLCHAGEYGVLGWLWSRARGASGFAAFVSGALVGLGVGILDESYQSRVPGRDTDALDVAADTIGAAAGALAWRWRRAVTPGT